MDDNSFENEKISIKNLLFTKAIPNYKLPVPIDGRPIFSCTDCGDKFLIKSSYEYHIHRKSLKITYICRYCHDEKVFFNRCNLLSHIRSHVFKTATINVSDLKIEPLPWTYFNYQNLTQTESSPVPLEIEVPSCSVSQNNSEIYNQEQTTESVTCLECNNNIFSSGILYKDRAKHYTQFSNMLYSCPICLLTLSTQCGLKAHMRLHLKVPPYFCPECGIHLTRESIVYPYTHDCESFRMMRVTAKLICLVKTCNKVFHPNENFNHLKTNHVRSVYKCSACSVACYKLTNMQKHLKSHWGKFKISDFFQCEICPGRLVIPSQIEKHLKNHESQIVNDVYPCWTCGLTFKLAKSLIEHQIVRHQDTDLKNILNSIISSNSKEPTRTKLLNIRTSSLFDISKKCQNCIKKFISRCPSTNIPSILNQQPCTCNSQIVCHLCKISILQNWDVIKKHYAKFHKEHVCLDVKIIIKKININQYKKGALKRKKVNRQKIPYRTTNKDLVISEDNSYETVLGNNNFLCSKCGVEFENKQVLEKHIVTHKDPFMAYQCMECGESFMVKRSFSTHLLIKHGIHAVNDYIDQKQCYNKDSLNMHLPKSNNVEENEPLKENQCNICREEFYDPIDLEKHFRVHGMAFLMKNTNKPTSPVKV